MSGRFWTDHEIGLVQDFSLSPEKAAQAAGRSVDAVKHMRRKIRAGWSPVREQWSADDEQFVLATPHLTAVEVAAALGRSLRSIEHRRAELKAKGWAGVARNKPWYVGKRRLLARTCPKCGLLLDSAFFQRKTATWDTACARCKNRGGRPSERIYAPSKSPQRLQSLTKARATRHGQPWVDADDAVLEDPDLTVLEKALRLGRTYFATGERCRRKNFPSKVGLGETAKGQWVIRRAY